MTLTVITFSTWQVMFHDKTSLENFIEQIIQADLVSRRLEFKYEKNYYFIVNFFFKLMFIARFIFFLFIKELFQGHFPRQTNFGTLEDPLALIIFYNGLIITKFNFIQFTQEFQNLDLI